MNETLECIAVRFFTDEIELVSVEAYEDARDKLRSLTLVRPETLNADRAHWVAPLQRCSLIARKRDQFAPAL